MSLWVDIINPSHVLFFSALLRELQASDVQITFRERAETVELANLIGMKGRVVGADHKDKLWKTAAMVNRTLVLMSTLKKFDRALSFENGMSVLVSRMRGRQSILLCDNDLKFYQEASRIQSLETAFKNLSDRLIIPEACFATFSQYGRRGTISTYDGYKEDVYIADFSPDPKFMCKLPYDSYVAVRPEALGSFYVLENRTLVPELVKSLISRGVKVVYLPRDRGDAEFVKGLDVYIPEAPLNGLDLCYHADAVLTGSGTMAREAACMGKPAVSFFPGNALLSVDRKLIGDGRMIHSRDPKVIVEHVMASSENGHDLDLERCKRVRRDVVQLIRESFSS
jgi:uncharacterized protein